jgi:hypothetical protein
VFRAINLVEQGVEEHDMRSIELKTNAAIEARFEAELDLQKELILESKFLKKS